MTEVVSVASEDELAEYIADAFAAGRPLRVEGGGSRAGLGRPVSQGVSQGDTITTRGLSGVTLHEPAEQVLSARAGTPLAEVEATLAAGGQRLAFESMDHRHVLTSEGEPTIGAVAAANISGPRRIEAGAARDSMIGLRAVTGRGEVVKSGGRVMKNVTGYDLVKFFGGSFGTLGVLSEVTFKVAPIPETERTIVLLGRDATKGVAALSAALGSPYGVTGAAHLPAVDGAEARTLIRLEGFEDSVQRRVAKLREMNRDGGTDDLLDTDASQRLWAEVRDLRALKAGAGDPVWRISVKPTDGPVVREKLRAISTAALLDWGGGLVWLAVNQQLTDAGVLEVRGVVDALGGHATLVRAPNDVRARVDVFHPLPAEQMALTRALKASFDPAAILNPGRMYEGV